MFYINKFDNPTYAHSQMVHTVNDNFWTAKDYLLLTEVLREKKDDSKRNFRSLFQLVYLIFI